jgi:polyhydroxybutyrate depolymerase
MKKQLIKKSLSLAFLLVLWGCSEKLPAYEALRPGTYEHKLNTRVLGFRRSYLIHIPLSYDRTKALPLVVALHGGFSTGARMEEETGLSELADREGFFVLYPNGISLFSWLQHWNAGHCCGLAMKDGVDDAAFISKVIDQAREHLKVDPARVYMVGFSNGGMLAHFFAAQKPETLAAVAVIAASIGSRPSLSEPEVRVPPAKAPLPILAFHGRKDDLVPYGGEKPKGWGHLYVPVKESMDFWVKANQCAPIPVREELMAGRVLKETWKGNENGREVILYTLEGWKHSLPTRYHTQRLPETDSLKGFHATDIIWEFFKDHHR